MTYEAETVDGRLIAGLLVKKDAKEVILKESHNKLITIPTADIEQLVALPQSMMPDLLYRDLTAQQVADLLAYLEALK